MDASFERRDAAEVAVTTGSSGGHFEVAWEIAEDAMSQEAIEDIEDTRVRFCATCQGRRDAMR